MLRGTCSRGPSAYGAVAAAFGRLDDLAAASTGSSTGGTSLRDGYVFWDR